MKFAIVTLENRPQLNWVQLSNLSKRMYCQKHGFDFVFKDKLCCPDRPAVWSKMPCLLQVMSQPYDYVMWVDADAIIANPEFDVTTLFGDADIYYNVDIFGLNFGIFALKNSERSKAFLKDIIDSYEQYKNARFYEQTAAADLINGKYKQYSKEIPARTWNSYDDAYGHKTINVYQQGDFILHLPNEPTLNWRRPNYRFHRFVEVLKHDNRISQQEIDRLS